MFETVVEALSNHILVLLPVGQPRGRTDLAALPSAVADYMGGVLDRRVDKKAPTPMSPWFDSDQQVVQTAQKVWQTAVREAAQFPESAWETASRTASRHILNFLVDPVDTLVSFVYADEAAVLKLDVIQERMASFSSYPYLRDVAESYASRKGLSGIDRDEFRKLLTRIDTRMVAGFGPADWMKLLQPLFDLVRGVPEFQSGVPAELLRTFFDAKGQSELVALVETHELYSEDALRKALDGREFSSDAAGEAAESEKQLGAVTPDEPSGHEGLETNVSEPLWQRLARAKAAAANQSAASEAEEKNAGGSSATLNNDDGSEKPPAAEDSDAGIRALESKEVSDGHKKANGRAAKQTTAGTSANWAIATEINEAASEDSGPVEGAAPFWKHYVAPKEGKQETQGSDPVNAEVLAESTDLLKKDMGDDSHHEPLQRLETRVLGADATERRDWYAQQLTNGSEAAYRSVLEKLDQTKSWDEAWPVLKEAYQTNKVEIYSDAIVAFTDAVEARYRL